MTIAGLVLVGLAAALHVFIFYLESIAWTSPRARATFGTTEAEAETTKSLAFNQGFYNLFLALAVFIGLIVFGAGSAAVGLTLVFVGAGSMLAAALVLALSSRELLASALKQGTLPLFGVVCLLAGVLV
ncbi:putative membrane protein [Brevibacterium epidermidis]|jgi:putative membrane protein|uniref:Membrane protein n=1 Tax=Brevibacterium epidermidis TaxID=1698 RepID=A0ABV4ELY9_BREEP